VSSSSSVETLLLKRKRQRHPDISFALKREKVRWGRGKERRGEEGYNEGSDRSESDERRVGVRRQKFVLKDEDFDG